MTEIKRLPIDQQLQRGWHCLYEVEADEDMPRELMLMRLKESAEYIAAVRARKRLTAAQREKLTNLEKWLGSYDLKRLQRDIQTMRRMR